MDEEAVDPRRLSSGRWEPDSHRCANSGTECKEFPHGLFVRRDPSLVTRPKVYHKSRYRERNSEGVLVYTGPNCGCVKVWVRYSMGRKTEEVRGYDFSFQHEGSDGTSVLLLILPAPSGQALGQEWVLLS